MTRITDPAMTPIMGKAAGIICEIGGMTSHPSIVSREMGIPCIVSAKDVLSILKHGMTITMDGQSGEIFLSEPDWIDDAITGMIRSSDSMDFGTLHPFSHLEFHPLFSQEWIDWLTQIMEVAAKQGVQPRALGEAMTPNTTAFDQLYFTLLDKKTAKLQREKRLKLAHFLHEMGLYWLKEDHYSIGGKHIIHTPEQVKSMMSTIPFHHGSTEIARLLGRIYSAAYQMTNGLYGDLYMSHSAGTHGPYDVSQKFGKGAILVIKDFLNLRPVELWPDAHSIIHDWVRMYAVYKDVYFSTSYFSCHSVYEGDPIKGLVAWAFEADGTWITDILALEKIRFNFEDNAVQKWKRLLSLDFETLKAQGLRMRCYMFNKVCKMLGMQWEPPQSMVLAVKGKPFATSDYWNIPKDAALQQEYWRKLLDPREDYFV